MTNNKTSNIAKQRIQNIPLGTLIYFRQCQHHRSPKTKHYAITISKPTPLSESSGVSRSTFASFSKGFTHIHSFNIIYDNEEHEALIFYKHNYTIRFHIKIKPKNKPTNSYSNTLPVICFVEP